MKTTIIILLIMILFYNAMGFMATRFKANGNDSFLKTPPSAKYLSPVEKFILVYALIIMLGSLFVWDRIKKFF